MLLNTTDHRKYEGNLEGETINVGIADARLIIDRLTDMYSDREMAVIREYSCNALDAQIEAGVKRPIEVTTPGPLQPFLTIRDYGIGLTVDDIREIYSQYGASTKRNTNTQTGAFGLGCKSGLAYSDQFTVTSVKDGIRIQVVVSRDRQAGVTMKVVDTSTTSEPNGTTVMVPARAHNEFATKAKKFFSYWRKGTVLLNGQQPEFMPGALWVTDDICINAGSGYNVQSIVVMGGVPYPVKIEHGLGWGKSITAFVPIGSLDIPGDRENVIDTDRTTKTLNDVMLAFKQGLHQAIRKDVENAGSPAEAGTRKRNWAQQVGGHNMPKITYKGTEVPDSYKCEFDSLIHATYHSSRVSAHSTYQKDRFVPIPSLNGSVWVTDFDYVSFTATVKKKLLKWCEDNGHSPQNFFLAKSSRKPDMTWLENITFVDWPTIKAIKLPKKARSHTTGRIPGSYDIFEAGDFNEDVPADDIDTTKPIFWMLGKWYEGRSIAEYLNKSYPGCTLVMMRDGRQGKFHRLFPQSRNAVSVIGEDFKLWVKKIDKDDALALAMRNSGDSRLQVLDATKIKDPEILAAKKVLDRDLTKLDDEIYAWRKLGHWYTPDDSKVENPLTKYVLLPETYYFGRVMRDATKADAIYRYLHCEYNHLKEQK